MPVEFRYCPGVSYDAFVSVTLTGGWDAAGAPSSAWSEVPMAPVATEDGSTAFAATVALDGEYVGTTFPWGVWVEVAGAPRAWGVAGEVRDLGSQAQHLTLVLGALPVQVESYRLSWHRARGATRVSPGAGAVGGTRFSVWAPNATAVELVFAGPSGYVADDGTGADGTPPLGLTPDGTGLWSAVLPGFGTLVGRPYMYRVTRDDGSVRFVTDMFSREQIGHGDFDPGGAPYNGDPADLDGRPSSSVVADPAFDWAGELDAQHPVPHRVRDLVIYELHVGALNPAVHTAGTFADALGLLPYLGDLGVNCIELMPMLQFDGSQSWGYGSSHFLAIESAAGGSMGLKAFVKACHQRGIAVLMDVVYNHYTGNAARAAWQYDSAAPERNSYYWYEGDPAQYASPDGGYLDNISSGWAPRYSEPRVTDLFDGSAMMLADECHIDGLRVDQTASIHSYNALHANGAPVAAANIFGRKFLRELCQTVRLLSPPSVLIAEDHSGWPVVTQAASTGGIGFDATWYVDFYHHLVGESGRGPEWAKLLWTAAREANGPLAMDYFAGALQATAGRRVVYQSSHDEAGNDPGSARTILVAVNGAPLVGETRRCAEARCRFAQAMAMLSAGTPMFLMGEEVGAQRAYTYDKFTEEKEDLAGLRAGAGAGLFAFYGSLIRFRLANPAIRGTNLAVIQADNASRVVAFRRWDDQDEFLVVASLNNSPFNQPSYELDSAFLGEAGWSECFNTDSSAYGGDDVGNRGATVAASGGRLAVVIPANGAVVFRRVR